MAFFPFVEESFGAWHVKGGLGQLTEKVYQRAVDVGVTFHLNSPVASITTKAIVESTAGALRGSEPL